jgi:hypothetical protein
MYHSRISPLFLALLASYCLTTQQAQATLIASETFGDYPTDGRLTLTPPSNNNNQAVVTGNTGFSATNTWTNDSSSAEHRGQVGGNPGLSHTGSLTAAGVDGAVFALPTNSPAGAQGAERNVNRALASAPISSPSYYLSGLVRYTNASALSVGSYATMGFFTSAGGIYQNDAFYVGFHLGLQRTDTGYNLVAVTGGSSPVVTSLLTGAAINTTYQVVLKLDGSVSAIDTVSAWYAPSGATNLTSAGSFTTETFSSTTDIGRLSIQSVSAASGNTASATFFDDVYLGTTLADVTSLQPVPEPTVVSALGLGLFMIGARRRRRA